jgi:hypothetical protein
LSDGPVRNRPKDLRVKSCITCQLLRVRLVALAITV